MRTYSTHECGTIPHTNAECVRNDSTTHRKPRARTRLARGDARVRRQETGDRRVWVTLSFWSRDPKSKVTVTSRELGAFGFGDQR